MTEYSPRKKKKKLVNRHCCGLQNVVVLDIILLHIYSVYSLNKKNCSFELYFTSQIDIK